ncbi:hypothetical protein [Actinomadura alba]|uniref:hypothetical protein n=1 Tax=Actinomadura alba TaxID=406431 RepID=UPI0028AFAC81|nr:hypothetical protein [Actinomadura alba]
MSLRGATAAACCAVALLAFLVLLTPPPAARAGTAGTGAAAAAPVSGRSAQAAPGTTKPGSGRVVIIGIPSLLWNDVSETGTPALWRLTGTGSAAALSVRATTSITCPVDGWLTVSAGQRARLAHGNCALPPAPAVQGENAQAAGWPDIRSDNAGTSYKARVGLLGDAVRQPGAGQPGAGQPGAGQARAGARPCTMAVGPGAVYGAADGNGAVDVYAPSIDRVPSGGWGRCALTVVEIDDVFRAYINAGVDLRGAQVPLSGKDRRAAAAVADRRVGQVLAALPPDTTVLVAGLSDTVLAHLHVALAAGPGGEGTSFGSAAGSHPDDAPGGPGYLTANSTRRTGLVTLTDVTATALRALGISQPNQAIGSAWRVEASADSAAAKVHNLNDEDVAAQVVSRMQAAFFIVLFGGQLLVYLLASMALRRRWGGTDSRRRILRTIRVVSLIGAAAPVATFLANVVPWWRNPHPLAGLLVSATVALAVVIGLALGGPWRRSVITPGLIIAGVTALVLGLDVVTGSRLELNAFMGYNAIVAGRFYGFGNPAFALFATAAILSAAWLAEWPLRAQRKKIAVAVVVAVGIAAMAIDGWPAWGSDFGGVLAIVPAVAVLTLMVAGKRVSAFRLGLFCMAGAVVVLLISYVDARRPAGDQSHLGRFWEQLMAGEAWDVIMRKAGAMLHSLGYWPYTVIAIAALSFLYFVLARPLDWRAALLGQAYSHSLTLRPALLSALTVAIIGMLMNDSGVVVPALVFSLAIPLVLAASIRALELDGRNGEPTPPEGPARRSASTGRSPAAPR